MDESIDPLEWLWDRLLSGEADRVRQAFQSLEPAEQRSVFAHLQQMASEPGWQPEQRASARAALTALGTLYSTDD